MFMNRVRSFLFCVVNNRYAVVTKRGFPPPTQIMVVSAVCFPASKSTSHCRTHTVPTQFANDCQNKIFFLKGTSTCVLIYIMLFKESCFTIFTTHNWLVTVTSKVYCFYINMKIKDAFIHSGLNNNYVTLYFKVSMLPMLLYMYLLL